MKTYKNKILSVLSAAFLIGFLFINSSVFAQDPNFSLKIVLLPQCMDNYDNDGDGQTDYPEDLSCNSPRDTTEADHVIKTPSTSTITISGKTSPNSKVKILKDGEVITHTKSDSSGNFSQNIFGFYSGSYNFGVSVDDKNSNNTGIYGFHLDSRPGDVMSVSGVYMQPTISIKNDTIVSGSPIIIDGYGIENSQVKLKIKNKNTGSEIYFDNKKTNNTGYYFYEIDTTKLQLGLYEILATTKNSEYETKDSRKVYINIEKDGTVINNSENYKHKVKCDLNVDTSVDLIDFSILIFHWLSNDFKEGDFNSDGIIDVKDFSIMAYNWTGY